jgi:DNA-binding NarL/FixJ family response regulator
MAEALRSPERLRVLVVDDHDVVHWGFRLMLTQRPWVERCLSATSGAEAVELTRRYRPHVALIDLFIGEESGAQVCEEVLAAEPLTRVLLFSGAGGIAPQAARAAGASGFVYKNWPAPQIAAAVRAVGIGRTVFPRSEPYKPLGLSERETEILRLMSDGATNPEIASRMHLSRHTIKEHTSNLYRKLEVRNRAEAVQHAHKLGLLP